MRINFTRVGVDIRDESMGATVTSGAVAATVILGPYNLGDRPTKSFTLWNCGTVTLSGAIVQVNPDLVGQEAELLSAVIGAVPPRIGPLDALWHTYDEVTFNSIGPNSARSLVANDLFRWWRILGLSNASAPITVSGWVHASSV